MDIAALEQDLETLHKEAYGSDAPSDHPVDDLPDSDPDEGDTDDLIDPPAPKTEDFEQKYRVLQGKYTAELDRMNNLLSSTLSERERLVAQLESTQRQPQQADLGTEDSTRFIDELESEYPTIAKGVDALLEKKLKDRLAQTERVVGDIVNTQARDTTDRYLGTLDTLMPAWREIKDNPEFSKWLSQADRYTGATRFQLLSGADQQRNPKVVAAFYEDFAREAGLLSDDSGTPAPTSSRPPGNIAPTTAGNPAPSTGSKGFITRDEITKFYRDRALGKFSGSDEDAAKAEGRIMKAVREGKVR